MNKPEKKLMGQPPFEPTDNHRECVKLACGIGLTQEQICYLIQHYKKPISVETLVKYFSHELEVGVAETNMKIAGNLARIAMGEGKEAVTAAIFYCKTKMKWRETNAIEISGPDGASLDAAKQVLTSRLI